MSGPASLFREIHRLRRFARDLQEHIERHPRLLKIQQAKVARQEDAQRDNQEAIKKLKLSIGDKELSLKTANGQIAKYLKAMDTASNMKEMEALRSQMATAQGKVKELEEAILTEMGEIDERTAKLPGMEKAVRQAREEYAKFEKAQGEKHADHQLQLKQTLDQLAQVEKQLPEQVRGQYERTIASMGADGLACRTTASAKLAAPRSRCKRTRTCNCRRSSSAAPAAASCIRRRRRQVPWRAQASKAIQVSPPRSVSKAQYILAAPRSTVVDS